VFSSMIAPLRRLAPLSATEFSSNTQMMAQSSWALLRADFGNISTPAGADAHSSPFARPPLVLPASSQVPLRHSDIQHANHHIF